MPARESHEDPSKFPATPAVHLLLSDGYPAGAHNMVSREQIECASGAKTSRCWPISSSRSSRGRAASTWRRSRRIARCGLEESSPGNRAVAAAAAEDLAVSA